MWNELSFPEARAFQLGPRMHGPTPKRWMEQMTYRGLSYPRPCFLFDYRSIHSLVTLITSIHVSPLGASETSRESSPPTEYTAQRTHDSSLTMTIEPLHLHRDHLSVAEVDLHDPYVTANISLFIIHNVLRRNLASCARHAKSLATANFEPFLVYARYTLQLLDDHLRCAEDIIFPVYAERDPRFAALTDGHKQLRKGVLPLQSLLATPAWELPAVLPQIADSLAILQEKVYPQFDTVEDLVNQTARQVPLETIRVMDERLEERRRVNSRMQGTVWVAFYLMRGLSPEERELGALRTPKHKLEGMLTAGELQFRREARFMPKF